MNTSGADLLGHPLAEPMLRFSLLPSLFLHPTQAALLLPEGLRHLLDEDSDAIPPPVLHRHWSAALRRQLNLEPVESLEEPTLPIALLDTWRFERLAQWCGIAVLAPSIRKTIARDDVALLQANLGEDGVEFARRDAARLLPEGNARSAPLHTDATSQALHLGSALLWAAFGAANPAVTARARLRLAPDAGKTLGALPDHLTKGQAALELAENVLTLLDASWLSSFPARRH
ncbi:MAG: hypothetical protein ABIR26_16385 [Ramlibacter sp.]